MGFKIQDGTGSSKMVKVTSNNRVAVESNSSGSLSIASQTGGDAFTVGTDDKLPFTLTSAVESALVYVKNNDDRDLLVDVCVVSQEVAGYYKFYRNPTTGTLIDSGTVTTSYCFNFGSSNVAALDVIKADATDRTFTDGDVITYSRNPAGVQPLDFFSAVVVPKGGSFGISFEPDGTGASDVSVFFFVHYPEIQQNI